MKRPSGSYIIHIVPVDIRLVEIKVFYEDGRFRRVLKANVLFNSLLSQSTRLDHEADIVISRHTQLVFCLASKRHSDGLQRS